MWNCIKNVKSFEQNIVKPLADLIFVISKDNKLQIYPSQFFKHTYVKSPRPKNRHNIMRVKSMQCASKYISFYDSRALMW